MAEIVASLRVVGLPGLGSRPSPIVPPSVVVSWSGSELRIRPPGEEFRALAALAGDAAAVRDRGEAAPAGRAAELGSGLAAVLRAEELLRPGRRVRARDAFGGHLPGGALLAELRERPGGSCEVGALRLTLPDGRRCPAGSGGE